MARHSKSTSKATGQPTASLRTSAEASTPHTGQVDTATNPDPSSSSPPFWRNVKAQKAIYLTVLAAIYSPLSQLILSPVYGSIPSGIYHKYLVTASTLLALGLQSAVPSRLHGYLPTFVFWIPTIHFGLFRYSEQWGVPYGPLMTELVTLSPLLVLSLSVASKLFEDVDLSWLTRYESLAEAAPPTLFYIVFTFVERLMSNTLPRWNGQFFMSTRVGLQLVMATMYTVLLPPSLFWPAIPSIAFTLVANPHTPLQRTSAVLNNTLALSKYSVLERAESITGYLSVLEDHENQFRVLRCDHSLLGGEWQLPSPPGTVLRVGEPTYAVFTMLEAVRLIEAPSTIQSDPSRQPKALNIGLGIGTAPSAMISHGVNTTIIEIDPHVHYFAGKYFNLPKNHSYHIGDAVSVVNSLVSSASTATAQYDMILHDTFTGGALPISLFTHSFLTSLSLLLRPSTGVIAINFAGDLTLPPAWIVYETISAVFPNCRLFREDSPTDPSDPNHAATGSDFTNLVYFCRTPHGPGSDAPITFRDPVDDDFLGSRVRREYMIPRFEVDARVNFSRSDTGAGAGAGAGATRSKESHARTNFDIDLDRVLDFRNPAVVREVNKWQAYSAMGHWRLMRQVLPKEVWENW